MKNVLKILLGGFITLIYIPLSIVISYTVISKLTNIFNPGYVSVILNIIIGIIGLLVLLALVVLLEKIIKKIIEKKIRFMIICTIMPIIIFCISMLVLNFNFSDLQKDMLNIGRLSETRVLNTALLSLSSVFIILSFIYLVVFVMYVIVYKLFDSKKV